ncbi:hypothetical protein D3C80_1907230 [compost metagenome]
MVIHAHAAGQRQIFEDTPFVFEEQRVLIGLRTATVFHVYAVFQFVVAVFAAERQKLIVIAERDHHFAVERVVF